jgi:tetratricopeptide (TPR) repeat protein
MRALDAYQQVVALARTLGDPTTEGPMLQNVGRMDERLARYADALDAHQQALAIARRLGDRAAEGAAARGLGQAYALLGQYVQALAAFDQALTIAREQAAALETAGDLDAAETQRTAQFATLNNVGIVYDDLSQPARALATYQQALALIRDLIAGTSDPADRQSYRLGVARTLNNIGAVYTALGDPGAALERYQEALAVARDVGDRRGELARLPTSPPPTTSRVTTPAPCRSTGKPSTSPASSATAPASWACGSTWARHWRTRATPTVPAKPTRPRSRSHATSATGPASSPPSRIWASSR